jgi:protoporphyrinogen oxidase
MMDIDFEVLSSNKVAVLNLGFDSGTDIKSHWRYFPSKDVSFYRVGFYNNILGQDRMSLYIEIGLQSENTANESEIIRTALEDLKKVGIIKDQLLVDGEFIVMDPAYVHITEKSEKAYKEWCEEYNPMGMYSIGRYGAWTYCSIEDNIIQARETAEIIKTNSVKHDSKVTTSGYL